jgi:hypothetical protein
VIEERVVKLIKKLILTLCIILPLSVFFIACRELYTVDKLTREEVIDIVYEYGIPSLPDGTSPLEIDKISGTVNIISPKPILTWQAGYLGDGKWCIQGVIATQPENKHYMTIWILYANRLSEQFDAPTPADGWVHDGVILEGIMVDSVDATLVLTEF